MSQAKKKYINLHILYDFAGGNPNRDDVGEPKSMIYGGYTRSRMSSQSLTRAKRVGYEAETGDFAYRSRVHGESVAEYWIEQLGGLDGVDEQMRELLYSESIKAVVSLTTNGNSEKDAKDLKKRVAALLSKAEVERLRDYVMIMVKLAPHKAVIYAAAEKEVKISTKEQKANLESCVHAAACSLAKGVAPVDIPDVITDEQTKSLVDEAVAKYKSKKNVKNPIGFMKDKGADSVYATSSCLSVAAFGRMFASKPEYNAEAAVQRASAFTTHEAHPEMDYFTTVDDLAKAEDSGAAHLSAKQFTGGTFYWYANIDIEQLNNNLDEDFDFTEERATAFVKNLVNNLPAGNKATAPIQGQPRFVLVVRSDMPVTYQSAFQRPVNPKDSVNLSIEALVKEHQAAVAHDAGLFGEQAYISGINVDSAPGGDFERLDAAGLAGLIAGWVRGA